MSLADLLMGIGPLIEVIIDRPKQFLATAVVVAGVMIGINQYNSLMAPSRAKTSYANSLQQPQQFSYQEKTGILDSGNRTGTVKAEEDSNRLIIEFGRNKSHIGSILSRGQSFTSYVIIDEAPFGSVDQVFRRSTQEINGKVVYTKDYPVNLEDTGMQSNYEKLLRQARDSI
jgi:hypothetical protein